MEKHYDLGEEFKNSIIELQKKAIELSLGNVGFDLFDKKFGNIEIRLTEYKTKWEVAVVYNWQRPRTTNLRTFEIVSAVIDLYNLSNDGVLEYDHTEIT